MRNISFDGARFINAVLVLFFGFMMAIAISLSIDVEREARAHEGEDHGQSGEFQISPVLSGLSEPTSVEFSSDGRIYVSEKSGIVKVFDGFDDATPAVFADLRTQVHSYYDRGLIGMTLHPNFPSDPRIYVFYTHDAPPGDQAPAWNDCERAEDQASDGCIVGNRLSVLTAKQDRSQGEAMVGEEQVLLEGWCQKYSSHSAGNVAFGSDGALYVSGGEGADFNKVDYGQDDAAGCDDPDEEGGALRAQDLETTGDPVGLSGTLIRVDPDTGDALPDNPRYTAADDNASRIIAYGFRNPFRFAIRPGTNEIWQGDVGWSLWEEINRVPVSRRSGSDFGTVPNYGWPCYEGSYRQGGYEQAEIPVCKSLYQQQPQSVTQPYLAWRHCDPEFGLAPCTSSSISSSMSGLTFYEGSMYPEKYRDALFFADGPRGKLWMMPEGSDGLPEKDHVETILEDTEGYVVEIQNGPGGELYLVQVYGEDYGPGRIVKLTQGPSAKIRADRISGAAPLSVNFDATESSDPEGRNLTYEWDLDSDGEFDDSTTVKPSYTYEGNENRIVRLRVTDPDGATSEASVTIFPDNTPPTPAVRFTGVLLRDQNGEIVETKSAEGWAVGDEIGFNGYAQDLEDTDTVVSQEGGQNVRIIPPDRIRWDVAVYHCYSSDDCHRHPLSSFGPGTGGGGIVIAPDHGFPAYLEFTMTATDSRGMESSVTFRRDPRTTNLDLASVPSGVGLTLGDSDVTPFTREVIVGSTNTVSAPEKFTKGGIEYDFVEWSDGVGDRSRDVIAPESDVTYTAHYRSNNAPETEIVSGPPSVSVKRSATFMFRSSTSTATFECSLDGAAFRRCTSPVSYASLSDGDHVLLVRAKGRDGTLDATPASRKWRVDATKPRVSLISPVNKVVSNNGIVLLKVSDPETGIDRSRLSVQIDGKGTDFAYDPDSKELKIRRSGISAGWHTIRISTFDAAGNSTTASWRLRYL